MSFQELSPRGGALEGGPLFFFVRCRGVVVGLLSRPVKRKGCFPSKTLLPDPIPETYPSFAHASNTPSRRRRFASFSDAIDEAFAYARDATRNAFFRSPPRIEDATLSQNCGDAPLCTRRRFRLDVSLGAASLLVGALYFAAAQLSGPFLPLLIPGAALLWAYVALHLAYSYPLGCWLRLKIPICLADDLMDTFLTPLGLTMRVEKKDETVFAQTHLPWCSSTAARRPPPATRPVQPTRQTRTRLLPARSSRCRRREPAARRPRRNTSRATPSSLLYIR